MEDVVNPTALLFGASGALGSALHSLLIDRGWRVVPVTRAPAPAVGWLSTADPNWVDHVAGGLQGVVWAGGANCAGTLVEGLEDFRTMFDANVGYVVDTLATLLRADCLADRASLVVLSSVWQQIARTEKAAYTVSKAAVGGLVRSTAADLGPRGVRINAVLPGVVQTPMTSSFLTQEQIDGVRSTTPIGRLVTADEVAETAEWLLSERSSGVTGASLVVDGGWSGTHVI